MPSRRGHQCGAAAVESDDLARQRGRVNHEAQGCGDVRVRRAAGQVRARGQNADGIDAKARREFQREKGHGGAKAVLGQRLGKRPQWFPPRDPARSSDRAREQYRRLAR